MEFESSIKSSGQQDSFGIEYMASTLAHEIRNPLQILRLQIESAMRGAAPNNTIYPILKSLERIEKVVDKVQRLSQKHDLQIQTQNLQEVIEETIASARIWLQAAGIEVKIKTFWEGQAFIQIDRELFQQVILNLVKNSVQSMPDGGVIEIAIAECENTAEINISDTGAGMAPEVLAAYGTPFFTTSADGNGLGSSFCKSIVTMHRGLLRVSSQEAKGTNVYIRLPKFFEGN